MAQKPDWRKESDYDYTKTLREDGWAWEFLRRNPQYTKEWKKTLSKHQAEDKPRRKKRYAELSAFLESKTGKFSFIPGFEKEKSFDEFSERGLRFAALYLNQLEKETTPDFIDSKGAGNRWGFKLTDVLFNPEMIYPQFDEYTLIFDVFGWYYTKEDIDQQLMPALKEWEVAAVYDLRTSIGHQTKRFKEFLTREQENLKASSVIKTRRLNKSVYIRYLRVLDAKEDSVKQSEIARIIFPNDDNKGATPPAQVNLKTDYKRAKKIRDVDYMKIPIKFMPGEY